MPKEMERSSSRHHRKRDGGEDGRLSKRSRTGEENGDRDDRDDRHRSDRREKDRRRSSRDGEDRDKGRDHRSHERDYRDRERERRSSSRSRRHDGGVERELERARSRERARERELEGEIGERESRRSKEGRESMEPEADLERDQRTVFAYQVRDVRLIMDRNSRRLKGVGHKHLLKHHDSYFGVCRSTISYIEFYDVMSVPQAIALSGQLLLGQPVMVKPSEAEMNLVQSTTAGAGATGAGAERKLYVGNLHLNMTEEQLRQIFEPFGPVGLVQLPLDLETGHCRGYGFVQVICTTRNGKLNTAGRIIKVATHSFNKSLLVECFSCVMDHVRPQDSGTNAAYFDDQDGGGLSLDARSRGVLMQKLDRTGTATSIAESLGVSIVNGALLNAQHASSIEPNVQPSECILLRNMFDPRSETQPDFDLEIQEDVREECSKFGAVMHIYVDKNSIGWVYLRFDGAASAANCQIAMHGRWFAGRAISAAFMTAERMKQHSSKHGGWTSQKGLRSMNS
ncbi:hypothetical protein MUK42_34819 [Musa troglodytarum]|uniref:RRM domain-containing protein n=1 Tax=Musa troglodytarum TaxID=320322 RepID=A0A9E7KQJ3_9LILI|nr:hypothetical protein MUK42_34819 [Musa troglodytarum]